jgi:hypothetical protein
MPRIYKFTRTGLKLLYKIRHHRGHGIHSPFVFNLITKVVEEKAPYHVYEDIRYALESAHIKKTSLSKENKLYFRLVNYFSTQHILEIGSGYGITTLFLTAPSNNIVCTCLEPSAKKYNEAKKLYAIWDKNIRLYPGEKLVIPDHKPDCIFINLNRFPLSDNIIQYLSDISYEKTFIIVKGIRTKKRNQALWKRIINMDSRTVVLDLFNIGIVFFDKTLYRWEYKISF